MNKLYSFLHSHELQAYAVGSDKRLLELADVANTLLHSYGSAFQPCPCSCKTAAFRFETLKMGFRNFEDGGPSWILCEVAPPLQHEVPAPPRGSFAIGSPQCCASLAKEATSSFIPIDEQHREITVHDEHGAWTCSVHSSATVLDLLRAHRAQADWNEAGCLYAQDQRLPLAQKLAHHHGPFQYVSSQSIAARPVPHKLMFQLLQRGQFLFEALGNIQRYQVPG